MPIPKSLRVRNGLIGGLELISACLTRRQTSSKFPRSQCFGTSASRSRRLAHPWALFGVLRLAVNARSADQVCRVSMTGQRSKLFAASLRGFLGATVLLQLKQAAALSALSDWYNGTATYYGGPADNMDPYSPSYGTKDGACGYYLMDKTKWPYWSVGALTPTNLFVKQGPAQACGACFEIWCQPGSPVGDCNPNPNQRRVTIMMTDICEPCNPGGDSQIDLQALTFLKIAPWYGGRINIRYRRVDCTPPSSIKLQLLNVNGDGQWLRMTVQEVAGTCSVAHVEVKGQKGDSWVGLRNSWGAAWEVDQAPSYPLDIRIVNDKGQEVIAYSAIKSDGSSSSQLPPNIQFTSGGASSPPVTAFEGPAAQDARCNDPEVSAFSLDVNAQTPQASNGGVPNCTVSPPPPANPPPQLPPAVPAPVLPAPQLEQQLPTQLPTQATSPVVQIPPPVTNPALPPINPVPAVNPVPNPVPAGSPVPSPLPPVNPVPAGSSMPAQPVQASPVPVPNQPVQPAQPALPAGAGSPAQPGSPVNPDTQPMQAMQVAGPNPMAQPSPNMPAPALPAAQPGQPTGGSAVIDPCACPDVPPDGTYNCQQQASFGKCTDPFMTQPSLQLPGGFCAATCKRCPGCPANTAGA